MTDNIYIIYIHQKRSPQDRAAKRNEHNAHGSGGVVVLFAMSLGVLLTWGICNLRCIHNGEHALW